MRGRALAGLLGLLPALAAESFGQLPEPSLVTGPGARVGAYALGLDFFENLNLAYEEDGRLFLETRGSSFLEKVPLGEGIEPHLAFDSVGAFVAYAALPSPDEGDERRIYYLSRVGPEWRPPEKLSSGGGEDRNPQLLLARDQLPVIAWEKRPAEGSSRIWFRRPGLPAVDVGRGERPAWVIDAAGRAQIFFLRDGDIFHAREESSESPGVFTRPVNVTGTPFVDESPPQVAFHDRLIYLAYEQLGSVFLASDRTGSFADPTLVAGGGASSPSLAVSPGGAVALAFIRDGDIHAVLGTTFFLPAPIQITSGIEQESEPRVAIDSFANLFIGFKKEGALYFVTTAGPPRAQFTADILRGEAPLTVRFMDESTGDVTSRTWDFGDGTESHDRSPTHVFSLSGEYVVSLSVAGPGGESPLADRRLILVEDPRNQLSIAGVSAFPGQRGIHVPILATHDDPAQGFTVAATYDPRVIEVEALEFSNTNISGSSPELFAVNISEDPDEPYLSAGVLLDVQAPFDGRLIPPGELQRIVNVIIHVKPDAMPGSETRIELRNQIGRPPLNNIFTVNGLSVLPVLKEGGTVAIARLSFPPPGFFIRGDADGNDLINITDAISTLNYLFGGEAGPACEDAADVTDDGVIDISDAVFTLSHLFRAGRYPPPPYPDPGLDPTADEQGPCLLR